MTDDPDSFEAWAAEIEADYKAGDKGALLRAIGLSILLRQPMPEWASQAFDEAYNYVIMGGARSWDDVFGKPHPAGKNLKTVVLDNRKYGVWRRVRELHEGDEHMPIDEALFERVGQEMTPRVGKTVISKLYYRVEHLQHLLRKTSAKS